MKVWILPSAALVAPAAAVAAEGGASPFAGDVGNAIWTVVVFVLLLVVLGKYAWGPVLEKLQSREQFIRDSLNEAKQDRERAEATLRDYESRLEAARDEAAAMVEKGKRNAEAAARRIHDDAQEEASKMVERAKREISIASEAAVKDLYSRTARLATDIAERLLARELTAQDHERLIADSIRELEELERN